VPRGFGPCTFLIPPILKKLVFLGSGRTKLSEEEKPGVILIKSLKLKWNFNIKIKGEK
jgi:hypothetical protein